MKDTPQVEDGYTRIANALVRAFMRVKLTSEESRIIWAIFSHTYGWNKKTDRIALSQFVSDTGISKKNVSNTLHRLIARKMVIQIDDPKCKSYGINKLFTQWVGSSKQMTGHLNGGRGVIQIDDKRSSKQMTHIKDNKDNKTKDNIHAVEPRDTSEEKKSETPKAWVRPPEGKWSVIQRIGYHYEDTCHTRIVNWGKQAKAIGNMTRAGFTEEEIMRCITYMATRHPFYANPEEPKGFDLMTVSNEIQRLKAAERGNT